MRNKEESWRPSFGILAGVSWSCMEADCRQQNSGKLPSDLSPSCLAVLEGVRADRLDSVRDANGCFFRQLLLRAENSQPRLLEIQCTVASGGLRQECFLLRTCLKTQQSPEIQVKSCFLGLLGRVNNTSLKKHHAFAVCAPWRSKVSTSPGRLRNRAGRKLMEGLAHKLLPPSVSCAGALNS